MRWLRISLYSLAGIVAILLTAIAVLLTVDFGRFKDRIESEVTELLGRELRIDGVLHANLGTNIELYAEDLYLANPDWATADAFVTARKIDVVVDTWSLINGPVEFERIEIDGVRVNIEKNESGDASWSFEALAASPDEVPVDDAPVGRLPVMLDYAAINDTQVSYLSSTMAQPLLFVAESLVSKIDGGNLNVSLTGSLNGTPLHFEKTTGSIENLLEYRDVTVDLKGNIGEIEIRGFALLDDLLSPRRPKLKIEVDGPNAQYLTDILLMKPISTGPLDLEISIEESGEQMVASLEGIFGEFNFNVNGHFQDIQELNDIHLDLSADGPDIGAIIRLTGREYDESDPFSVSGKIVRSGPEVTIEDVLVSIGESRLTIEGFFADFPTANGANLSLIASGPDYGRFNRLLGMPGLLSGAFTTSLSLVPQADGRTLVELDVDAEHVKILLHSLLSPSERFVDSTLQLNISGADVGVIAEAAGYAGFPSEEFEIAGSVEKDRDGYRLQNLRALFGDDLLQIDGHIGDKPFAGETDFEIRLSGSDLGASVIALGGSAENLPKGAYHLAGRIQKQDDKLWLRDIESVIGDHDQYKLELSGFLTIDQEFRDSQVRVQAKGASLAALASLARVEGMPDFPFEVRADVRRGSSNTYFENGFFGSGIVEVDFAGYVGDKLLEDDLEFTFDADVPRMKEVIAEFGVAVEQIPVGDLVASGTLRNKAGRMSLEGFAATFEGARLNASGRIGQLPTLDGTSITFALSGADLSRLLPPEVSGESLAHDYSVEGRVGLSGSHLEVDRLKAELGHASASGEVRLALDPLLESGRFSLKADSPDLFQLFPKLKDVSVRDAAKMKFRGGGNWSDNYWNFDNVRLELGNGHISLSGGLDGPPSFDRTDLNIEWHASSVRNLSVLAGRELPDHPLHLTARLVGTKDVMTMEGFALTFGESDLQGDFTMRSGDVPAVKIDVKSQLFDISEYAAEPAESPDPPPSGKDRKVIPDTPLPLELLRSFDADVAVEIAELRTRALIEKGVRLKALLSGGALTIENLSLISQRGGHLKLSADLVPNDAGGADFALVAGGKDLVMGFAAKTEEDLQQLPLFELSAELAANGTTVRDLAGSLDGYFRLVGGAGRLKSGSFSMFTQDFITEVINAVNPFAKKDPYTNVTCAVILLQFDDGMVKGKPALVQQTEKLRIFANTEINLKTEKLNADFKMIPQKGLGLSISNLVNPYIRVSGTLGKPSLELDPESILIEGGVAVATAGLSILAKGFKDRFLSEKDPCGKAVMEFDASLEALQAGD
jgi:hypothetical protein